MVLIREKSAIFVLGAKRGMVLCTPQDFPAYVICLLVFEKVAVAVSCCGMRLGFGGRGFKEERSETMRPHHQVLRKRGFRESQRSVSWKH